MAANRRTGGAAPYRVYWLAVIDVLLPLCVKFSASLMRSRRLVHLLYRRLLPAFLFPRWRVTDRSDRQLLMRHDLFRHLEMEVFVAREHLAAALDPVVKILRREDERGSYVHHYPICIRRVLPDDTLISMASCHRVEEQDWYAISLITLTEPREPFQHVAALLAEGMSSLFGARLQSCPVLLRTSSSIRSACPLAA